MTNGEAIGAVLSGLLAIKVIEKTVDLTEDLAMSELDGVEGDVAD